MSINYDSYRIFYHVAQCRNLTQAAVVLESNQPNVTRSIKNLETALGCKLFIRSRHGVTLTPEGEKLYAHISHAVEHIQAGEEELFANQSLSGGSVTVAVSDIALHCCLLPVLKEYRSKYPGVRVKVSSHSTPGAIEAVRNGLADFAVVTEPFSFSKTLRQRNVKEIQEVAVCGGGYGALAEKPLTCEELVNYPLIGLGPQSVSFSFFSQYFSQHGQRYQPDIEATTVDQILPMVRSDLGIGFVPEEFLADHLRQSVYILPLVQAIPPRSVCVLEDERRSLSIAAGTLAGMIVSDRCGQS